MASLDKLKKKSQEHLEPGEEIKAAVKGYYETKRMGQDSVRGGAFLATDRRLVFYASKMMGYDLESFPYENISSFEQGSGFTGGKIAFFASGNKASMKNIKDGDLEEFVAFVKSKMGKPAGGGDGGGGTQAASIPDQIKQLADLNEAGVLSDEEFQEKKAELLDRM